MKAITAALLGVIGLTGPAFAWGSEGHRVVAEIAEQYLEPATARQVRELLVIETATTLAQVSTRADRHAAARGIKVLMMAAGEDVVIRAAEAELPYVVKPFRVADIIGTMSAILSD
jgi:S1/P1 Nuclease